MTSGSRDSGMSDLCQYPGGCFQPLPCATHSPRHISLLQRATERAIGSPAEGQALRTHGVGPMRAPRMGQLPALGSLFEDDALTDAMHIIRAWANGATVNIDRLREAMRLVVERYLGDE